MDDCLTAFVGANGNGTENRLTTNQPHTSFRPVSCSCTASQLSEGSMRPLLTANEINDVIKQTSVKDQFTEIGMIPSHNLAQAGYGKIDAMAGVKKILGIDTSIPDLPRQQVQVRLEGHTLFLQEQEDVEVTVYSISGKQVMTTQAKDGVVQLNGLASGVYAVKVGQKGSTLIRL